MKKIKFIPLILVITLITIACDNKLVSEKCPLCGDKATKNYVSKKNIEVKTNGQYQYTVKADEKISICDKCYDAMKKMNR